MKINQNMSAVRTNNQLLRTEKNLAASMERLSSGYKINHAGDNPAGMAISNKMKAQIDALDQAESNASDGVSVLQIADGALNEVSSMLQRISELSVKAANGIQSENDRQAVQDEINQLNKEIDRISSDTEYNTKSLLDGTNDVRTYGDGALSDTLLAPGEGARAERIYISDSVPAGKYTITVQLAHEAGEDETLDPATPEVITLGAGFSATAKATIDDKYIKVTDADGFSMDFTIPDANDTDEKTAQIEVTEIGAMTMQIGGNEHQTMDIRIPEVSSKSLYTDTINVVEEGGPEKAMRITDRAVARLSEIRSRIGASQNRLDYATNSLSESQEDMTSAFSNIMDTDMATEMTEYTQKNILNQASISVLSQANDIPQQVLSLLSK